jgi:hypothetical protein
MLKRGGMKARAVRSNNKYALRGVAKPMGKHTKFVAVSSSSSE